MSELIVRLDGDQDSDFSVFFIAWFLKGFFTNYGHNSWFFGGQDVVKCVVNVVKLRILCGVEECATNFVFFDFQDAAS